MRERLYRLPDDELMDSDLDDVFERWWDLSEPSEWEAPDWSLTIEEWSVAKSSARLIGADLLLERIVENSFEYSTEDHYQSMSDIISTDPEIKHAANRLMYVIAQRVDRKGWQLADRHLRDYTVTFDGGRFLLDGEPTDWRVDDE